MSPYRKPGQSEPDSILLPFDMLVIEERTRREESEAAERAKTPTFIAGEYLLRVQEVKKRASGASFITITCRVHQGPGTGNPYLDRVFMEIVNLEHPRTPALCFSIISACFPDPAGLHEMLVGCDGNFDMQHIVGFMYWATIVLNDGYTYVAKRRGP